MMFLEKGNNMDAITVMKRREFKFILTKEQLSFLKRSLVGHMDADQYGKTTILSLYYDTPDFRLIRASIEIPAFKEKIRLRSYGLNLGDNPVFLELKRKNQGVVYKRRITLKEEEATSFFNGENCLENNQIGKEITYFRNYYKKLIPQIMVIYDRVAYKNDSDLRLTIDENPRYRAYDLNMNSSTDGMLLLPHGSAILEIKAQEEIPLWLVQILSEGKIYKTTFSKVGEAYRQIKQRQFLLNNLERRQSYEITI